jgi:hypothetical protein
LKKTSSKLSADEKRIKHVELSYQIPAEISSLQKVDMGAIFLRFDEAKGKTLCLWELSERLIFTENYSAPLPGLNGVFP